jgi:hypothetical protein
MSWRHTIILAAISVLLAAVLAASIAFVVDRLF